MIPDAVVVGAGIVGCSIAYELARQKQRVVVLDKGEIGREASWAAGGILTPIHLADYPPPLADLCARAQADYPRVIEELREHSREEVEFRRNGMLLLVRDAEDETFARRLEGWKREHRQPIERDPQGLFLPDIAQVRNHRLTRALADGAIHHGAEFRSHTPVIGYLREGSRIHGVRTEREDIQAGVTILAAGAWSGEEARRLGLSVSVRPAKGQMLLTRLRLGELSHMILYKDQYLVPRVDGSLLIGSTVEETGFDKTVTIEGSRFLLERALSMLPSLRGAPLLGSWAGLRPATPDRLPYIGPAPGFKKLIIAAGHFRNGILLGPITGVFVRDLILGHPPDLLNAFRLDRAG